MASEPVEPQEPPPPPAEPSVAVLAERLGVRFADPAVALAALTHKSYVNEHRGEGLSDNERLEFLGDAVIDLAVSHRLMERFPVAREGELSKIRAAVVDETGLARIAREVDLGSLLRLGRGEELTGGRQKSSLLADAMEAVIAVVYLDGGLEPVLALVDRFLDDAFARAVAGTLDRDYKTQFQELAQSRLRATPRYRVVAEHGPDHSKVFDVELELRGEIVGRGAGRSKKDAEQAAAKLALDSMNGDAEAAPPVEAEAPPVAEATVAIASEATAGPSPGPSVSSAAAPEAPRSRGRATPTPTATEPASPAKSTVAAAPRPRKRASPAGRKPRGRAAAARKKPAARASRRARRS